MVRVARRRGHARVAAPAAAIALGSVLWAWPRSSLLGFVGNPPQTRREPLVVRHADVEDRSKTWQQNLDTALLDIDATPQQRLQSFRDALANPGEIVQAVAEATQAIADKGLRDGHPEALDALFPKGTIARSDLEGLVAVARQAPEVVSDLRASSTRSDNARPAANPPDFAKVSESLGKLLSPEGLSEAAEEASNILRSTPVGLEEPAYTVVRQGEDFEIRQYQPFTVATRAMSSEGDRGSFSADGFNALAGYLFGDNDDDKAMKMTMPVEIDYDSAATSREMSFVLPAEDVQSEGGPPVPRDPSVKIEAVPERLVAVRRFPGVATDGEVKRQVDKLYAALEEDGSFAASDKEKYSVLQYNPPYTIPWRRRNEVVVVVQEQTLDIGLDEGNITAAPMEVEPTDVEASGEIVGADSDVVPGQPQAPSNPTPSDTE